MFQEEYDVIVAGAGQLVLKVQEVQNPLLGQCLAIPSKGGIARDK
jgi:hypothetical protein